MATSNGVSESQVNTANTSTKSQYLEDLQRDGYVQIPSLLPRHLLLALQATCKYLTERARTGKWQYVRTVPKQYPPWPTIKPGTEASSLPNIWGVQHLLHPDMPVRDVFAEVYFSEEILSVVKALLNDASDDELVMELFNLLISPDRHEDFELRWHRDDVRPEVDEAEEVRLLEEKAPQGRQLHAQYNVALFDDESLIVVPGSHRRPRTQAERTAEPYEANMPDQVVVHMKPGDAVFYDSNILHRGIYHGIDSKESMGRMTLHGSVGLAGHGTERARQVLQHAVGEWVNLPETQFKLEGKKGERAEAMRKRLVAMGSGEGLGYSLDG